MVCPGGVSAVNNFNGLFVKKPFVALLINKDFFGCCQKVGERCQLTLHHSETWARIIPMARFQKGQSGNPGGRPKVVGEVRHLAQQHSAEAIATLVAIMHDEKAPPAARV
jgi:hypothetical protein